MCLAWSSSGPAAHSAKNGLDFCQHNMLRYVGSTILEVGPDKHGYCGMDTTTVSGRRLCFHAFQGPPSRKSCWLVPEGWCIYSCPTLPVRTVPLEVTVPSPPYVSHTSTSVRFSHTIRFSHITLFNPVMCPPRAGGR